MTKFEQPSFSSPPNSKKFRDNWDKIFGPKEEDTPCKEGEDQVESDDGKEGISNES